MDSVIQLQPSLLHALFVQHGQQPRQVFSADPSAPPATGSLDQQTLQLTAGGMQAAVGGTAGAPAPAAPPQTRLSAAGGAISDPAIAGSNIQEVVTALLTGVTVKPEDMQYLVNMVRRLVNG